MSHLLKDWELEVHSLPILYRGKVRDVYDAGDNRLLIVATNRLSAFDVVLPKPMEGKGVALTEISDYWFNKTQERVSNHCLSDDISLLLTEKELEKVGSRCSLVRKLKPLAIEAVVRGYLIGSGWKDYQSTGSVCGIQLVKGLQQGCQLAEPIYTPATKAAIGEHDENISYEQTVNIVGQELASQARDISISLYQFATEYAQSKGIIIADTKFEFGLDDQGQLRLMDELLTPDSSRFWDINDYAIGVSPPSYDKQIIRDYLETLNWDKSSPGPILPDEIMQATLQKYREVISRLKS